MAESEDAALFQTIRDYPGSPDAEASKDRVIEAYLSFCVGYARRYHRGNPDLDVDDLVGAASLTLLRSLGSFAKAAQQKSFTGYLRVALHNAMIDETYNQRHWLTGSRMQEEVTIYLRKRSELDAAGDRPARLDQIAAALGISIVDVIRMETLRKGRASMSVTGLRIVRHPLTQEEDSPHAILVDRALSLLPAHQGELMREFYGTGGETQNRSRELAQKHGMSNQTVRTALTRARTTLRTAVPKLQNGTFDYLQWRTENAYCKTPLVMAGILGVNIRPGATMAELGVQAAAVLRVTEREDVAEQLIRLYGLEDGAPVTGRHLARENAGGPSEDTIYRNERLFLQRQKNMRDKHGHRDIAPMPPTYL